MAISYPLTLPSAIGWRAFTLSAEKIVQAYEAPFTFQRTNVERTGERWRLEVAYPPLTPEQARQVRAFLLALNGPIGTFRAGDVLAAQPTGTALGSPVVAGASQAGKEIATGGWTANQTNLLKAGDYLEIDNRLYMVTNDAAPDGSGNATIDIWPSIRQPAPSNGASITTSNCKTLFRLDGNSVGWVATPDFVYEIAFGAIEAL